MFSTRLVGWQGWGVVWPLALVLAAFVLRLYRIDTHGIWFDEALSVHMARLSLVEMVVETAEDIHPPLYYALLSLWILGVGTTEFALRYLSAAVGALAAPLMFVMGRRIGGLRLGCAASALIAASPLLVYYSQETRMYVLSASLAIAAGFFAWRAITLAPPGRWLPGYIAAVVVGTYVHLYALLAVAAFNVAYLLLAVPAAWRRRDPSAVSARLRPVGWWVAGHLAVVLSLLPWLPVLLSKDVLFITPDRPMPLDRMLADLGRSFVAGVAVPEGSYDWLVIAAWLVAAAGLALPVLRSWRRGTFDDSARGAVFAALWLVVSFAAMYVTLAGKRDFAPRYLIVGLPAFTMLLGFGLVGLYQAKRWLLPLSAALLLAGAVLPLADYYRDPSGPRPDYRGAIGVFERLARPGDGVVLNAHYASVVFEYYHRGDIPHVGLPTSHLTDRASTEKGLVEFVAHHDRIWVFYWQDYFTDSEGVVESWLSGNLLRFHEQPFLGWVRLKGYEKRPPGELAFGDLIRLEAYDLTPPTLRPGEETTLRLHWRGLAPMQQDYHVFVHLVDEAYNFYGQHDGPPDGGKAPTSVWTPGGLVLDLHPIRVAESAAGKDLEIRVGLYDHATGARLPTGTADHLLLARVRVADR